MAEAGWIGTSYSAGAVMEDGPLGSRRLSLRLSGGGLAVRNSCPIPDLVPPSGEFWKINTHFCRASLLSASLAVWVASVYCAAAGCAGRALPAPAVAQWKVADAMLDGKGLLPYSHNLQAGSSAHLSGGGLQAPSAAAAAARGPHGMRRPSWPPRGGR